MIEKGLGRKPPANNWEHYEKYPLSERVQVTGIQVGESKVGPVYPRWLFDQGSEGSCVGFGCARTLGIINREIYDPWVIYNEARKIDEWPGEDYEGTSVRAGLEVLRSQGARDTDITTVELSAGIEEYRWASTVDEIRGYIALGVPVVIGVNWYSNFDRPVKNIVSNEWWIGQGSLGSIRGGHCVCLHWASDKRQAFRVLNSWGRDYPYVWLPYNVMQRLIDEDGEVGIVVDRPGDPDPGDYVAPKLKEV